MLGGRLALAMAALAAALAAQIDGTAAYREFLKWQRSHAAGLNWTQTIERYRARLRADGLTGEVIEKTLRIIAARDEAVLYNPAFSKPPEFNTKPNQLLVEAVAGRKPGRALDVGMGQGRNAIYLAQHGWDVTGFDVAEVGLAQAKRQAAALGLKIKAEHLSDEEFDFGTNRWDLIAILYAIEKRSVFRVRQALRPGGLVVIESHHKSASDAPPQYDTGELLEIFKGFRILKYEDTLGMHDWARKKVRLVRLIAQKTE